ncbi:MAG: DUF4381 domain-containing protein [Verrucomicrobiota bacterium]
MNSDPTSLDRLHDLVTPPPAPWWPLTPGPAIALAVAAAILLAWLLRIIMRWQADRYRREALALLEKTPPEQLSSLAKRVALTAWPREEVANLTGKPWLEFLDRSGDMDAFVNGPGNLIESLAFDPAAEKHEAPVRDSVREWIRKHRKEERP